MKINYIGPKSGHSGFEVYSNKLYTALEDEIGHLNAKEPFKVLRPKFLNSMLLEPFHLNNEGITHVTNQDLFSGVFISSRGTNVVTVHDIFPYTEDYSGPFYSLQAKLYVNNLEKHADRIIAISEFTKEQILQNTGVEENKIEVIYQGVDLQKFQYSKENPLNEKYYLHVGSEIPRKNICGLIELFSEIREEDEKLIRVGSISTKSRKAIQKTDLKLGKDVIYMENISDEKLVNLYSHAEALLFPSHAEGFGRPIIESLACGSPVIAYDKKPMSEILPKEMLAEDSKAFIQKAKNINQARNDCRQIAENYKWSRTAKKTKKLYKEIK